MNKLIPKEKNVGYDHNDLQSRIGAALAMLILFILSIPQLEISDAYHRLLLLQISLIGTGGLAWGLVFGRKNIVAGLISMTVPLGIYMFPNEIHRTLSMILAPVAILHIIITITLGKCVINSIFSINSYTKRKSK